MSLISVGKRDYGNRNDWLKFIFWTTILGGVIHGVSEPQSIKTAFSSFSEFVVSTFSLILMGIVFGSLIYGFSKLFRKRSKVSVGSGKKSKAGELK